MIWLVYVLLSALLASLSAVFDKVVIRNADSTVTVTIYAVIAAVFLLGFSLAFKKIGPSNATSVLSGNNVLFILLSGTIYGLSWLFYATALKHGPVTKVAITDQMTLLFTVLLGGFLLGECLQLKQVIGTVLITIGAYLVAVAA